jgi:C2 domain of PTEN tumour-suppressor protein
MSGFISMLKKIGTGNNQSGKLRPTNTEIPSDTYFISPKLVLIPFPSAEIIERLENYFNTKFTNKYMIWNLSEYQHPADGFSSHTLDFIFVGYPNPPLSVIFSILNGIHGWLESDKDNISILHCQNTKGRSYMILASYLTWTHEFSNILEAFNKICMITRQTVQLLPSQTRYINYVEGIFNNIIPKSRQITIQKIILDGIPLIETEGSAVRPYIQIYKNSELVFSTYTKALPLVSYFASDFFISFDLDLTIKGDVLIRCRHLGKDSQPLTIFRIMFHTAFSSEPIIRFNREAIDGACVDDRFPQEFTVDLILSENLETDDDELLHVAHSKAKQPPESVHESDEDLDDYFKSLESK